MKSKRPPRRIMIGATHSGAGKTTVSLGLMMALRRRGHCVQGFKAGPDYIDPSHHEFVTGRPARNLDTWMMPENAVRELLARNSEGSDVALIEGVMGLYDGVSGTAEHGSSAHLAKVLRCPVILVINAASMARSAAAVVLGFKELDPDVRLAGVIANNIAGDGHLRMVRDAIEKETGLPLFGYLRRNSELAIPERHLGLVPKAEGGQQLEFYEHLASEIEKTVDVLRILAAGEGGPTPEFHPQVFVGAPKPVRGRVAVARDEAFSFYYQDNLDLLSHEGAEVVSFSPLHSATLPPDIGLVYIGGGFPELYSNRLSTNASMIESLRAHAANHKPIYAECGGLMYLSQSIETLEGRRDPMVGLLPVRVRMTRSRVALGYVTVTASRETFLCKAGNQFRGHEFHYSCLEDVSRAEFAFRLSKASPFGEKDDGIVADQTLACYAHAHFGSCPALAARLVAACCGVNSYG